ncbi:16S rRNA (cytosine(1402)-N(4))-methyltransferase RsmH [Acidobacteria bacterium AH-259-O06]|nr:16S rRNA (cytosine(1402)-N(4))-methyltransferase RsmH [Acidobacteria bacterium AH-259-O06]
MIDTAVEHIPVLLSQVLEFLQVRKGGIYVDCTVGLGGHSEEILRQLEGSGRLIALDRDKEALERARERLRSRYQNFQLFHENFKNLPIILPQLGVQCLDGCLVDLGVSSHQLDSPERGFSFQLKGPLDMRMDKHQKSTAADLVNQLPKERLAEILWRYGEEKAARRIAAAIVQRRKTAKLRTTTELAELVEQVKGHAQGRIHPATRVFQALRIEVNQELAGLEEFLQQAIGLLAPRGRLVAISFHSLEDRIVKTVFQKEAGKCVCFRPPEFCTCPRVENVQILTKKPVTPDPEQIMRNPRARSAKLRAVEKLKTGDRRQEETGDRRLETGARSQNSGARIQEPESRTQNSELRT